MPDDKDWTWVLERPCPDCGYNTQAAGRDELADAVSRSADRWSRLLVTAPDVTVRPAPDVWSKLEYGCHIRDVQTIFAGRLERMLTEDGPTFENWDQDATSIEQRYSEQDPAQVAGAIAASGTRFVAVISSVDSEQWNRPGLRSNGSQFTVETLTRYGLHDLEHHWWDVT